MYTISRRSFLRSTIVVGAGVSLGLSTSGCGSDSGDNVVKFAVISDPHLYDKSLGTTGKAFEDYLAHDRKMLIESEEIFSKAIDRIAADKDIDFLIIPGDLTKDAEIINHELVASYLKKLDDAGIKCYVVPGNHDVNNPHSVRFEGDAKYPEPSATPEKFAEIYDKYGYGDALHRDPNSLSYIAEVGHRTWLFALDSCKYDNNIDHPETSGAFSSETIEWVLKMLKKAKEENITVFGMMHHGVVEHFPGQTVNFSEYVVDEFPTVGKIFGDNGLNVIFTGHFHAQDIVKSDFGTSVVYDVETGSTVTAPCPYRVVTLNSGEKIFDIESRTIDEIASVDDFANYKVDFTKAGMVGLYKMRLSAMGVSADMLDAVANAGAEIHMAHYKGDESVSPEVMALVTGMAKSSDQATAMLGQSLVAFATDTPIADNTASFQI